MPSISEERSQIVLRFLNLDQAKIKCTHLDQESRENLMLISERIKLIADP